MRVCDQLESQLVDSESVSTNEITLSALQQEMQQKDAEIQRKDGEIQRKNFEVQRKVAEIQRLTTALHDKDVMLETLRSDISKLQISASQLLPNEVSY